MPADIVQTKERVPLGSFPSAAAKSPPSSPAAAPTAHEDGDDDAPPAQQPQRQRQAPERTLQPAAQPVPREPEPQPRTLKIRYQHQDLELDETEARRLAQLGLSAQNLNQRREQFERERTQHSERVRIAHLMETLAATRPKDMQLIERIVAQGADAVLTQRAGGQGEDDDDPLTPQQRAPSVDPDVERRFARLEQLVHQTNASLQQRDQGSQLEKALDKHEILRATPELERMARLQIGELMRGDADNDPVDLQTATTIVAGQVKRMLSGVQEHERKTRESRRDQTPTRSGPASAAIPRIDPSQATYSAHKAGKGRGVLADWLKRAREITQPSDS